MCQSVVVGERAAVDDGKFCSFFSSVPNGLLTLLFFSFSYKMMMVLLALEAIKYVDIHGSFWEKGP